MRDKTSYCGLTAIQRLIRKKKIKKIKGTPPIAVGDGTAIGDIPPIAVKPL